MTASICLAMMIKNEGHVIARALASALPHVDAVVITDTGSTDGTQEVVEQVCRRHNIEPVIVDVEWRGFAETRTLAFENARQSGCAYALMLDADDELRVGTDAPRPIDADAYRVRLHQGRFSWLRADLVRLDLPLRWRGSYHEQLIADGLSVARLPGWAKRCWGNGARGTDPDRSEIVAALERDVELEPTSSRARFCLAQEFWNAARFEEALARYRQTIELSQDADELWWSWIAVSLLMRQIGDLGGEAKVADALLRAYACRPEQAEPLVDLAGWCRTRMNVDAALPIARATALLPMPDSRFRFDDVYLWRAKYERALAELHGRQGSPFIGRKLCDQLLAEGHLPADMRAHVEQEKEKGQ